MAIWDGEQSPGTARSESRKTLANNDKACLEAELWELGEQTLRQNRALYHLAPQLSTRLAQRLAG
ncbi:hypothetical protein M431DRAFT_216762 [Trichoderma harzianum CBS 226.95]|uniref:Uncharacterized protein n=1 Tax=Trichoderma harzianum CBS 226.95 TaxID=983964 RepID=A0A2T4A5R1_TRIHA|nr:hypothetical protein M431DRAFT_216762 [Trichoderma harzianum CBS 226.95]PTB52386.1 hypothetical protein M431DRAFT_216762 [Trichoderma harzianum CBS 226.95]